MAEELLMMKKSRMDSIEQKDNKLLKKSRSYNELITKVSGIVKNVYGKTIQNSYTTDNGVCGPGYSSNTEKTGQSSLLEITLEKTIDNHTVETLIFDGYAPIKTRQKINFYIFQGEEKNLSFLSEKEKVLIPRELNKKENALYLEIGNDIWDSIHYNSKDKVLK